jgi:hypothetical protein
MDPSLYGADVDEFRPERFLDSSGNLDPNIPHPDAAFGFGRRKCAGQVVAQKILWLAIASMLSTFDISQSLDEQGKPVRPSGEIAEGLNWYVLCCYLVWVRKNRWLNEMLIAAPCPSNTISAREAKSPRH